MLLFEAEVGIPPQGRCAASLADMARGGPARIGARIRKLRVTKGLSQREVAEPLMTPPYLSLIEAGQRTPSEKALEHIALKLGVDALELATGMPSQLEERLELLLQEARGHAHRGDLEKADNALEEVLAQSRRYQLDRITARALCVAGTIAERKGEFVVARDLYDEAQTMLRDESPHRRFEAVVGYARIVRSLGEPRLAAYLLETYLVELRRHGVEDPTAKMRVHSVLVQFYRTLGLERQSIEAAEEALRLAPRVHDPEHVACMNMNVARSLLDQGRHEDAMEALRQAEQIYQSLDWPLPAVRAKVNTGIVALDKQRLDAAHSAFSEAVAVLEKHPGEKAELGAVLNLLGRVERLRGNGDVAADHLKRARKVLPKDDTVEHAMNAFELGLSVAPTDSKAGERELRRAADAYKSAGAKADAARALLELGHLLNNRGEAARASTVMVEGLELTASSGP